MRARSGAAPGSAIISLLALLEAAPGLFFGKFLLVPFQPACRPLLVVQVVRVCHLSLKFLDARFEVSDLHGVDATGMEKRMAVEAIGVGLLAVLLHRRLVQA